ncbi:substrate-binding periplasmic protein [Echinicola shivajiensis]|uniref:substrate-binding periplasmic protein n=1 Tax=Echinicola shivajiensis TaxID=1035916 RepID=UPI001BFC61A6|nr:transporter substrate-binding domain-containing protein [Echinicola shivajiensis]
MLINRILPKIILSICLMVEIFSLPASGQETELKLASDIWPPFTDTDPNSAVALNLVREALNRIGVPTEVTIQEFDDVMSGIEGKIFDGSAALWMTGEREATMLFSNAYMQNQLVLVGKRGQDVDLLAMNGLANRSIGLVKGYAYNKDFENVSDVTIVQSASDEENFQKLLNDEVDCILVDALLVEYLLKQQNEEVREHLVVSKSPFIIRPLYFALRKDYPGAEKIIKEFNKEIRKMSHDGSYHKLLGLDWLAMDINNDGVAELVPRGETIGVLPPQSSYMVYYDEDEKQAPKQYYIGGKMYDSWDDIPDKYKHKIDVTSSSDPSNPGIRVNF